MQPFEKTIFIGGGPCSGTTLLNNWLCRHPLIAGAGEVWAADYFVNLRGSLLKAGWFSEENIDEHLQKIFYDLFKRSDANSSAKYLLNHNTRISSMIPLVSQLFPDAYYIFVIRDGRRVLASLKSKWYIKQYQTPLPSHLTLCLRRWTNFANAIISGKLPPKTLLLRYDDITGGADRKIADFLSIDWHEQLDFSERINTNFSEPKPENYWQEYLDEKEQRLVEYIHPQLKVLGFEV